LQSLSNNNIRFFGAGYNRKQARTPIIQEIVVGKQIFKFVVFSAFEYRKGYDEDFSFYASSDKGGVNRLSFKAITKKIKNVKEETENVFIVVFPHWGGPRNYGGKTDSQTEMGHKLIDAGADLIIGGGPHNLQQIEKYKDRWILYSLGNFVYNSMGNFNKYNAPPYGLVIKLIFSEKQCKNSNNPLQNVTYNPISKSMRIYSILTDNSITKFQNRFVNEREFEFIYRYLISDKESWKPSEKEVITGIDRIGRFIELSLDLPWTNN
jgi:hypothetical protein